MVIFLIVIIACAALYVIYRWIIKIDNKLQKIRQEAIQYKDFDEQTEEEKQVVSTALKVYGQDTKFPLGIMVPNPEKEEEHDKCMMWYTAGLILIILIAVFLMLVIS